MSTTHPQSAGRSHRTSAVALALIAALSLTTASTLAAQEPGTGTESNPPTRKSYDADAVQEALERARALEAVRYPGNEPSDGVWTTAEDGRSFFVARIDKKETPHLRRVEGQEVRFALGLVLDLVEETDTDIYVTMPKVELTKPRPNRTTSAPPTAIEAPVVTLDRGDESLVEALRLRIEATPFDRGLPTSAQWRNDVIAADMNGDGNLDLVHGPPRKSAPRVQIFLGDGAGGWQLARTRFRGGRLDYGDIAVADFDQDGQIDLALSMHLLGTTVAYGRDKFTFQERAAGFDRPDWAKPNSRFGKRAPWSSRALEVVDVDLDGDLDVLAVGEGSESLSMIRVKDDPEPTRSEGLTLYLNNGEQPGKQSGSRLCHRGVIALPWATSTTIQNLKPWSPGQWPTATVSSWTSRLPTPVFQMSNPSNRLRWISPAPPSFRPSPRAMCLKVALMSSSSAAASGNRVHGKHESNFTLEKADAPTASGRHTPWHCGHPTSASPTSKSVTLMATATWTSWLAPPLAES